MKKVRQPRFTLVKPVRFAPEEWETIQARAAEQGKTQEAKPAERLEALRWALGGKITGPDRIRLALTVHLPPNGVRAHRRRHLQKVLFPNGLEFDGESFGTPVTCLFFRDLEAQEGAESQMVSPRGFVDLYQIEIRGETRRAA